MKKSAKLTIGATIATVGLAGMFAAYQTNGDINFTDNAVARTVTSAYKATENAAVTGWAKTEDFFVSHLFQQDGETTAQAKERLQNND